MNLFKYYGLNNHLFHWRNILFSLWMGSHRIISFNQCSCFLSTKKKKKEKKKKKTLVISLPYIVLKAYLTEKFDDRLCFILSNFN